MLNTKRHTLAIALYTALTAFAPVSAKTLTVAFDVSGSNPLLNDTQFNRSAARYVADAILSLEKGDEVVVQTFGSLDAPSNFTGYTLPVKRHNTRKIAAQVSTIIQALPSNVAAQGSTNLIAWLGRTQFDCSNGSDVIVLTDAIEASEYVNPNQLLAGKQALPAPNEFVALKGCTVTFFGLGVGRRDNETLTLRRAWQRYFDAAGAQFTAVVK